MQGRDRAQSRPRGGKLLGRAVEGLWGRPLEGELMEWRGVLKAGLVKTNLLQM